MIDADNIKQGLRCCIASTSDNPFSRCEECPYDELSVSMQECRSVLSTDALELIEELEAGVLAAGKAGAG